MFNEKKVLIIGKIPPPIGGVTIHVSRLLKKLERENIAHDFKQNNIKNLLCFIFSIHKYSCIHIHSSNPFIRLYVVLIAKILNVKSIVTFHGDIGRFKSTIKNKIDHITIRWASKPIVLNNNSFLIAKKLNNKTEIVSSFIPPDDANEILPQKYVDKIQAYKKKYEYLFCSNAYNLSYDKEGMEIYGIFELIETFKCFPQYGFILSDPSGAYFKEIKSKKISLTNNICIITGLHSFYKVMSLCDASIRNTSTDGDSISVKESLYLNKITFTTDVVSRPVGCILYKRGFFKGILHNYNFRAESPQKIIVENGFERLKQIYDKYNYNETTHPII
jgi:glycosyltransferase involved in cell wall biosynthesis